MIYKASTSATTGAQAGIYIAAARAYLGAVLVAGQANATLRVYRGNAATAGNEIGAINLVTTGTFDEDSPNFAVDVDLPTPATPKIPGQQSGAAGIFIVVVNTAGLALVRYST